MLVAGGSTGGYSSVAIAELYDPATNTWSPAASMSEERFYHPAVLLGSGKVLVVGGQSQFGQLWTTELYDPATNTWSPAGSMSQLRTNHTGTLLGSGQVLVTGGYGGALLATAELYDPPMNLWLPAGTMSQARYQHTATLLGNGKVLVAGGPASSAELYSSSPLASLGTACVSATDCQSGFCVDGVCCNTVCNAGSCDACAVAAGAAVNGTCSLLTGPVCDDGNACTLTDTCQAGVCAGLSPVACAALDQCHAPGVCDPVTGSCSNPAKPDGASCDDGNPCTQVDSCQSSVCLGSTAVVCAPLDSCHVAGVCDPATAKCSNPTKPEGAACDDGSLCSQGETCQAGVCTGGSAVVCAALDSCHVPGQCDPASGVCTNITKPDTAACDDGDACTQVSTCQGGVCTGIPVACKPVDECHDAGSCDSKTGECSSPAKPDGALCSGGACRSGACIAAPDGGSGGESNGGEGGESNGGCGCGVAGAPVQSGLWAGLALLIVMRRRRARRLP